MLFPLHGLCYSAPPHSSDPHNRSQLIQCELFTDEETKSISCSISMMEKLFENIDRSIAAEEALTEFKEALLSLSSSNKYDLACVDRRFRAYVMEFRLFLDHWIKYIGDLKEDGEVYKSIYKDVTSDVYDHNESYVLATVIRNYVVHGYNSIDLAHIDRNNNVIYIYRDNLSKIDVAKSARLVIGRQSEYINLLSVAEESFKALQHVQEQLINYQITDEVGQAAVTLLNAKKRIDDAGIMSDYWILIEGQQEKMIQWAGAQRQGIDLAYQPVNWTGYIAVAQYVVKLWQEGYWREIQKKYMGQQRK